MNIGLIVYHTSPFALPGSGDAGGMNIVVRHQAEELARLGHRVDIVTRRQDAEAPTSQSMAPGLTLHLVTAGPSAMLAKSRQDEHLAEFEAGLAGVAALERVELLHSHHWMSGVAGVSEARRRGVPHLQSYHSIAAPDGADLAAGEPAESPGRGPGERLLARVSDRLIAISEAEARSIVDLGADPRRVQVVLPGVDGDIFYPRRRPPERPGYVVVASRLQPLKGVDLAVRAVAGLEPGRRPRLVVAGDASHDFADYEHELAELIRACGLAAKVDLIGPRTRHGLAQLLRGARATLVPSHSETFGLIALESASCGVPVIAGGAGGLRESVADGISGLVLGDREPATWTAALAGLLSDDAGAAQLGASAARWAAGFGWDRSAARLAAAYAEAVADHQAGER